MRPLMQAKEPLKSAFGGFFDVPRKRLGSGVAAQTLPRIAMLDKLLHHLFERCVTRNLSL